jgi:cell division protein FtsL
MIYKRILALITVVLLVVAIYLVKKKAKNQSPQGKISTETKKTH